MAVDASHHCTYNMLKTFVGSEATVSSSLEELKNIFANEIGSVRRLEGIKSVRDLIDCMERRDVLNEYNIDVLREIADNLDDHKLQQAVAAYVTPKEVTSAEPINQYQEQRLADEIKNTLKIKSCNGISSSFKKETQQPTNGIPATTASSSPSSPNALTEKQRASVYKLLSHEIGTHWRFLGRELCVREGEMDAIELQFPSDLASRIFKLLQLFENDTIDAEQTVLICRALDACGRKDLRRKVEKMVLQ